MKKCILLLMPLLFKLSALNAQTSILNLNFKKNDYKGVRGAVLNDSAFIALENASGAKCYWLTTAGAREVDLPELNKLPIFAVGGSIDSTFYYFLKEEGKRVSIKALTVNASGRKFSTQSIELKTRLYGSYVENGNLFLLTAETSGYSLMLLEYRGFEQVKNTRFALPFDLGKFRKSGVSFYQAQVPVMPADAIDPIKVVKDKGVIWISIDEPKPQTPDNVPYPMIKTIVCRLDLVTGQVSNRLYPEESFAYFNSVVYGGHLYRVVQNRPYKLDIFNLMSGKKVYSGSKVVTKSDSMSLVWVSREGQKLRVTKTSDTNFDLPPRLKAFVLVDSVKGNGVIISLGDYYEISPRVPGAFPLGVAGVLIPLLATAAIREIGEGPVRYEYVHFQLKEDLQLSNISVLRRQRIDDFEMSLIPTFKGYLHTPAVTFGFYVNTNSTGFKVVRFE